MQWDRALLTSLQSIVDGHGHLQVATQDFSLLIALRNGQKEPMGVSQASLAPMWGSAAGGVLEVHLCA